MKIQSLNLIRDGLTDLRGKLTLNESPVSSKWEVQYNVNIKISNHKTIIFSRETIKKQHVLTFENLEQATDDILDT